MWTLHTMEDMEDMVLALAQVGVILTVLAVGLGATFEDAVHLLARPLKLGRALFAMFIVMPTFVLAMTSVLHLKPIVAVTLMALAVAPIPPLLPRRVLSAGGAAGYTTGLLAIGSLLAVVFVPVAIALVVGQRVSGFAVARVVTISVLGPLAAGLIARRLAPGIARRVAEPASRAGLLLVALAAVPLVFRSAPAARMLLGDGTLVAIIVFNVVGLMVGRWLGGPVRAERTVLALTTSSRHPGVAFLVATSITGEPATVVAALVLYLVVNALVTLPYAHSETAHPVTP